VVRLVVLSGLYVTLSVSLNLINGITGQFSIGHAAFYQIGAYLGGYLTDRFFMKAHMPDLIWLVMMMLAGALGAAIAGFVVGLPSLRLRGDYLAIVTLGFGEIIRIIVQNTNQIGGAYGMTIDHKIQSVWMVWLLAIVCIAVSRNLLKTARGLTFLSVREDEIAASAMGVNVTRIKLSAFLLGSAFAGAAGAVLAHFEGFITPLTFGMDVSFIILTMVVLGGTGSITGSVISAIVLSLLPEMLRGLKDSQGSGLTVTGSSTVACLLALVVAVALVRRISLGTTKSFWMRMAKYVGALAVAAIAEIIFVLVLNRFGALATKQIPVEQLRLTIFAITLIVLMLLRPQGLMAHHEFSWSWVKKLLGRPAPRTAVAS
jgi:branched-chain amino acid transport system permease protein